MHWVVGFLVGCCALCACVRARCEEVSASEALELTKDFLDSYDVPSAWSGFRGGPQSDGYAHATWHGLKTRILWRSHLRDDVQSAPIAHDGVCWVASKRGVVYGFDVRSGRARNVLSVPDTEPTSMLVESGVVVLTGHRDDGSVLWFFKKGSRQPFAERTLEKPVTQPLGSDGQGRVFIVQKRSIRAFDTRGRELWSQPSTMPFSTAPASRCDQSGQCVVYVGTRGDDVIAYDASSGQRVWSVDLHANLYAPLAVVGRAVIAINRKGELSALDAVTGGGLWSDRVGKRSARGAAFTGGKSLVAMSRKGSIRIWNLYTGGIEASWDTGLRGRISPVVVGDSLILIGEDGAVHVWSLGPKRGRVWAGNLGKGSWETEPAVVTHDHGAFVCVVNADGLVVGLGANP